MRKKLPRFLLVLCVVVWAAEASAQTGSVSLVSPDEKLEITFQPAGLAPADAGGQLGYSVAYEGKPVVSGQNLGLAVEGGPLLGSNVRIRSSSRDSADETYEMPHGRSNPIRNHYNSLRMELAEPGPRGRKLIVDARAYNDGVAFRYIVPAQPNIKDPVGFRLHGESTEFRFAKDSISYPLYLTGFHSSYEDEYTREAISGIPADRLIAMPLLVELGGIGDVAITEAHLEEYAGAYLKHSDGNALRVELSSDGGPIVEHGLPHSTPWRVIMVAPDVGRLIESNIVINLNPPSAIADTSWIKPGKSVWDWWFGTVHTPDGFVTAMDTRTFKYLIDFAAESGFQYALVDDGWSERQNILEPKPGIDIQEIVEFGKSKGIGVWLWLHVTGVERHMEEAFPLYEKWGVVGLKIDFMDSDNQWMVNWYHRVIQLAAKHHLMVDFHGAYKPTGLRRTYPNLMTREAVMGLEYTKWSRRVDPEHNMMLPFTRMLVGPLEYTPGGFGNVTRDEFTPRFDDPLVLGTRAHQLSLFVIFESPFLCAVDHPTAYRGAPEFQFIKDVPTTWDETRVLMAPWETTSR